MKANEIIAVYETLLASNPEYRKQIGAFYTPKFIVDYMVSSTLNSYFEGKTENEIINLTVIDPACGGGAFLVGTYLFLLDYYQKKQPIRKLSIVERKSVLIKNIFGVDIDEKAIIVCKKALLMICYDTDCTDELDLEVLNQNIKC